MRIIAGSHRRRIIQGPKGQAITRPITDRVKQSLFDRLSCMDVFDGPCLDLFCGTGSLGLEALSRGSTHCTFVDRHRGARLILQENLQTLQLADRATVMGADLVSGAWVTLLTHQPMSLVFCDPPYEMAATSMDQVSRIIVLCSPVTVLGGVLVLRTDARAEPTPVLGWALEGTHHYGKMCLSLYTRQD